MTRTLTDSTTTDPTARRVRAHVAIGGAVGALLRTGVVLLAAVIAPGGEVSVVLAVNLIGAFALGWLAGRAGHDARWARLLPLLGTGVLGAATTFSTLADQVARAALSGAVLAAIGLAVASLVGGVVAGVLGLRLGVRAGTPAVTVEEGA